MCATGKAAKRNDEFIQQSLPGIRVPCSTIHKALGAKLSSESEEGIPEEEARINRGRERFQFEFNKDNKLPFDIFIVDESSMADVSLAASLLEAIPDGSRLLFVGDHYQLPSVGPGAVLRDLMAAGIPSTILEKPRRNSGIIAHACYLVKEGKYPNPVTLANTFSVEGQSNWTHREIQSDEKILDAIRDTHIRYIKSYGIEAAKERLQVISPEKKGILGCNNLNIVIANIINPSAGPIQQSKDNEEGSIRVGDKVVRNRNNTVKMLIEDDGRGDDYEQPEYAWMGGKEYLISQCDVVNGDSGEVIEIDNNYIYVVFSNPSRLCRLPKLDARISLAYALTVHKCQGSGFPVVIMPLTDYYWNEKTNTGLYCRELFYTALSRPSERLITFGKLNSAHKAINRMTIHQRKTWLKEILIS